jgi:membrane fusion protein (multidrug efflux system)
VKQGILMNFKKWLITLVILTVVVVGLFTYKSNLQAAQAERGANMPEPASSVSAELAAAIAYQPRVKVSGEVQAFKQLTIANELAGKITALNAQSGGFVKQGQILLELDYSDEAARLIAAKAQLVLNEQTLKRYIKLQKSKEISEELVDQAQASVDIAKSNVAVLTTAIDKKKITAPFDARVGIHNLEVGQFLDKNNQILTLTGVNEFTWVDFYLPQAYQEISLGTAIEITPIGSNEQLIAEIIAINPQLSQQSRHLKYRAQISKAELSLKPHTLLNVSVPVGVEQTLVSVPDLAIIRDQLGNYIFVLEPAEEGVYRAKKVKVELADRNGDTVMIASGVSAGQLIATKGAFKLYPNKKVFIAPPAPSV